MTLHTPVLVSGVPQLALGHHVRSTLGLFLRRCPITRNAHPSGTYHLLRFRQEFGFNASSSFLHQVQIQGLGGPAFMDGRLNGFGFIFFYLYGTGIGPGPFELGTEGVLYAVVITVDFKILQGRSSERAVGLP